MIPSEKPVKIKTPAARLVCINPMKVKFMGFDKATIERFWSKVDKRGPDDCWEWQGAKCPRGYGSFWLEKSSFNTHRVAMFFDNNRYLDKSEVVCHKCDNKTCVNPQHLYVGTQSRNMLDKISRHKDCLDNLRQRLRLRRKLCFSDADKIRCMYLSGHTLTSLSRLFNVKPSTVFYIVNHITYKT